VSEFLKEAVDNIRGTIRFYKIQEKKSLITSENPLVNRYFSVLSDKKQSKVVHNGWILDARPDVDFATEINFNYLRRTINIWGDSIKLRFGKCPADSPFLWEHMAKYVT
jgi:glycogen debranching enzyme